MRKKALGGCAGKSVPRQSFTSTLIADAINEADKHLRADEFSDVTDYLFVVMTLPETTQEEQARANTLKLLVMHNDTT